MVKTKLIGDLQGTLLNADGFAQGRRTDHYIGDLQGTSQNADGFAQGRRTDHYIGDLQGTLLNADASRDLQDTTSRMPKELAGYDIGRN